MVQVAWMETRHNKSCKDGVSNEPACEGKKILYRDLKPERPCDILGLVAFQGGTLHNRFLIPSLAKASTFLLMYPCRRAALEQEPALLVEPCRARSPGSMALAGLPEDLIYKIRTAKPKPKAKPPSHSELDSENTDRQLLARLASLAPLIHASTVAAKSLQQLADGFHRSTRSIGADAVFLRQLQDNDPPMAAASKGMIDSFGSFGELFSELSARIRTDLISPMEAVQNNLKEACMDERIQIKELEQQESVCAQAVREVARRKEKASAELQAVASAEGKRSWFRSSQSARLEELAAMQTAVVEDLASKIDQEAAVKRKKEQCVGRFKAALKEVDQSCLGHLQKLSEEFRVMWIETGQRLANIAVGKEWKDVSPDHRPVRSYLPPHRTVPVPDADQAAGAMDRLAATDLTTNRIELELDRKESKARGEKAEKVDKTLETPKGSSGKLSRQSSQGSQELQIYAASPHHLAPAVPADPAAPGRAAPESENVSAADETEKVMPVQSPEVFPASVTLQFGEHVRKLGFEAAGRPKVLDGWHFYRHRNFSLFIAIWRSRPHMFFNAKLAWQIGKCSCCLHN